MLKSFEKYMRKNIEEFPRRDRLLYTQLILDEKV